MSLKMWNRVFSVAVVVAMVLVFIGIFLPEDFHPLFEIVVAILLIPLVVMDVMYCRCPHCDTFLWHHRNTWAWMHGDHCPYCGEYLYSGEEEWYSDYVDLNYLQGELEVFQDRSETMLLVTYKDGMHIHVGYDEAESEFVITVYENDSEVAKETPLAVHRVFGHNNLLTTLQKTVHTWRDDKIDY